jgi:phage head maturation protease
VTIVDPESKNFGQDSYLSLKSGKVESCVNGFRIIEDGEICVEYQFV